MSPIHAIAQGIRAVNRTKRMWLVYWLATTIFALVCALPVWMLVSSALGHSLWADRLMNEFDPQFAMELASATPAALLPAMAPAALVLAAAFVLLGTFLAGGAIAVFTSEDRAYSPGVFWSGCGKNFARLFRLWLISLLFYTAVLFANNWLAKAGQAIWGEGMEEHPLVFYARFRMVLILLLFFLVSMIFDYAKIRLVARDSRKTWRAAFGSVALVLRNFRRTAGTFACVLVLGVALLGVYTLLRGAAGNWVVQSIVLAQAYVVSRIWIKLLFYASQTEMYLSISPQPETVVGQALPPAAAAAPDVPADVQASAAAAPASAEAPASPGESGAPGGTL
jgi:hypothetical protein